MTPLIATIRQVLLKHLKRWLGWEGSSGLLDFGALDARRRPSSTPPRSADRRPTPRAPQPTAGRAPSPPPHEPAKERKPMDVLDNPRLTLDKPGDDGFDPYNTGAFNRSASWEKIGRQRKR